MEMQSGGDLLPDDVTALDSIHILRAGTQGWQQLGCVQTSEGPLRDLQDFPDQVGGRLHALVPLARRRPQLHGGEWRHDDIGGSQMQPVVLRELIIREGDEKITESFMPTSITRRSVTADVGISRLITRAGGA